MELHKRKVFSAGTTSATCYRLCDQKIATRTARWVHRSCAKMEERTEFRVYSGPDHSHCIPKWPATITGRLNVSHYSCLLFHRRLLILGSNRRLVSPFLVLNKTYKRALILIDHAAPLLTDLPPPPPPPFGIESRMY